jgi:3-oxoacyl-[acyl-carrier protein] reductase
MAGLCQDQEPFSGCPRIIRPTIALIACLLRNSRRVFGVNMVKNLDFSEQVVLVTGGSRGLGFAIVQAFVRQGARVVLNYHATPEEDIRARCEASSLAEYLVNDILLQQADITDAVACRQMFDAAEQYFGGPVTTVINNAMVASFEFNGDARPRIHEITWAQIDQQLQGFLRGALNTTQAALPGFEKIGYGRIINAGSNLFSNPVVPYHDYTAAKGSLLAFTRTSAAELGAKNITVNMVSGGLLRTTDASASTPDEVFGIIESVTPMKRVIIPEEVADVFLFFASPWARAVTGQDIQADGGLVMR